MKIVVLGKFVPEPTATWRLAPDFTIDRAGVEGRFSELDEYAVETAVRLVENGLSAEIVCLTVGPPAAADALRKPLAMGADSAVHVVDDAIHGSDALATSLVVAAALRKIGFDLVLCGMGSTDADLGVLPAMVAERLGVNQATFVAGLDVHDSALTVRRETDAASVTAELALPAIVSVTDQSGTPRYPAFRAIAMAKKKPVQTWSLADLDVDPAQVGLGAAATRVLAAGPKPKRTAGAVVADDGTGAAQLADFLAARGIL